MERKRFRMGFLVNPIAGLGGRPGLKGSDDAERVAPLLDLVEDPVELPSYSRALDFLAGLKLPEKGVAVAAPGSLGETIVKASLSCDGPIFEIAREPGWSKALGETDAADTKRFARLLARQDLDLLVFVGGDGTAIDVAQAIGEQIPILGVPAGVKMFSGVFAETPIVARTLVEGLVRPFATERVDVVDLDEASYTQGSFVVRAQAQALVPVAPGVQLAKGGSLPTEAESLRDLASWFAQAREPGRTYVLGAGSTMMGIKESLGGGSPLGVDVYRDGAFVAVDASEEALLSALPEGGPAAIVVSPTARQGCILGRGTAQISPEVLERVGIENVQVVATPGKLLGLSELFVDTGDAALDRKFPDYVKVRTDPNTEKVFRLRKGGLPRGPRNR